MKSISRLRPALGTFVAIECEACTERDVTTALGCAFEAIGEVDRLMHPTRPGSDLAAIRGAETGQRVAVHPWTREVLALTQRLHELSGGLFDPCLPERPGRLRDVQVCANSVVCTEAVAIDLGGVAKGYAVDQAIAALQAGGCHSGMVNAGGDLRVFGERSRPITVRSRRGSQTLALREAACAVSEPISVNRPGEHRGYYRRDLQVQPVLAQAAVVVADATAVADALTKCVLLSSTAGERRVLQSMMTALHARQVPL